VPVKDKNGGKCTAKTWGGLVVHPRTTTTTTLLLAQRQMGCIKEDWWRGRY
jgi:hypothetical protein